MNLNTIVEVKRPASPDEITQWRDGYAWLGGGSWLFSEPQWDTDTLIDLDQFRFLHCMRRRSASKSRRPVGSSSSIVSTGRRSGPLHRCFAYAATRY